MTADSDLPACRLGRQVIPLAQTLRLDLDPDRLDVAGSTELDLEVREAVQTFRFHAEGLDLESLRLGPADGSSPVFDLRWEAEDGGLVAVSAGSPLEPGLYRLEIAFRGHLGERATSLYRYVDDGQAYVFSQFQPDDARRAFPCWDEPCFKIPFQVILDIPAEHVAISNTAIEREVPHDGRKTVIFERTPPLPAYLLAILVGPLEWAELPGLSVPGRVYTVQGQSRLAAEAVRYTPPILASLERYFGAPYPYGKLDLVAVPEFWPGAMENPGAVTFSDRVLLIDPEAATAEQRRDLVGMVAHELSHMWFGGLVTMAWWDDLWLNEAFATWMGNRVAHEVLPDYGIRVEELRLSQAAMVADSQLVTRSIRQPVHALDNLLQSADTLAYNKGRTVLEMFELWVGSATFRRGLLRYLETYRWGVATAEDLWRVLSQVAGRDVSAAMATFLEQPGIPLLEAQVQANGSVRLSQSRFLNLGASPGTQPEAGDSALWQIPVTIKYPAGQAPDSGAGAKIRSRSLLLAAPRQELRLEDAPQPEWIYPNAGERGYYRWHLPPEGLARLTRLGPDVLEVRERVGLVHNLTALLDGGLMPGDDFLAALLPFAEDPAPEVINELADVLGKVGRTFAEGPLRRPFAAYVRRLLGAALRRFGWQGRAEERQVVTLLRPRLLWWLGGEGEDEEVRCHGSTLARAFLADRGAIDPSLVGAALQIHARHGDGELLALYQERFEASRIPMDRYCYAAAMGQFQRPELVRQALAYALEGSLRPQEFFAVLQSIFGGEELRDLLFDWLLEHYAAVTAKIPPTFVAFLPRYANGSCLRRLEKAEAFFGKAENAVAGTDRELAKIREAVHHNVGLRRVHGAAVARFLEALD